MTKADLIQTVAAQHQGMTKKAAAGMVDVLFETIGKTIKKEGRFFYPGVGTWTVRAVSNGAAAFRHPRRPQAIYILKSRRRGCL